MRFLVYTCVFGGYDRVYPPVTLESELDYIIVTDDPSTQVKGWKIHVVDSSGFATPKSANLHYRALIHRYYSQYCASVYVDGNIRVKGGIKSLLEAFLQSGCAIGAHAHPLRGCVASEAKDCIFRHKVLDAETVQAELAAYAADGFLDDQGLVETTILLKNHDAPGLDQAMALWDTLYATYLTRDQLSLPYVLWKTKLTWFCLPGSFRDPNPRFSLYPHLKAAGVSPLYTHVSARSHDNLSFLFLLMLWHFQWFLRRSARRLLKTASTFP